MSSEISGAALTHRDRLPRSSRYELLARIASGGMATVYVGRLRGAAGFSRLVAIKRTHAHLLEDEAMKRMLLAETELASKIHHPNVVAIQDVEVIEDELLLVMDYVEGDALSALLRGPSPLTAPLAVRVVLDACAGLHAAHVLTDDHGRPLHLVHRDVSPQNILVGVDGITRLVDFGIAKPTAEVSSGATATGVLKGKPAYMAPEYIAGERADAASDVFGLGVVAWEALTGRRLFRGENDVDTLRLVLACAIEPPSEALPALDPALDAPIMKALARSPDDRFQSAEAFAEALETAARRTSCVASHAEVGRFVKAASGAKLDRRREIVRALIGEGAPPEPRATTEAPRPAQASLSTVSLAPQRPREAPTVADAIAAPASRSRTRSLRAAPIAVALAAAAAGIAVSMSRRPSTPESSVAIDTRPSADPVPARAPSSAPTPAEPVASSAPPPPEVTSAAPPPRRAPPKPASRPTPTVEKAPPNPYAPSH